MAQGLLDLDLFRTHLCEAVFLVSECQDMLSDSGYWATLSYFEEGNGLTHTMVTGSIAGILVQ